MYRKIARVRPATTGEIPDRALTLEQTGVVCDGALHGEATVGTNRDGRGSFAERRNRGGMRTAAQGPLERIRRDSREVVVFRIPSLMTLPARRYNSPHDVPLTLPLDPLRHLNLDLRRLAGPGLQAILCQERIHQGVSGRVLSVSVRGRTTFHDCGEQFDLLPTSHPQPTPSLSDPDLRRFPDVF